MNTGFRRDNPGDRKQALQMRTHGRLSTWRTQQGAGRNSAIGELKFLAQVLDEAIARGFVSGANVCRKLRIRAAKPADKIPWSDEEVSLVQAELEKAIATAGCKFHFC